MVNRAITRGEIAQPILSVMVLGSKSPSAKSTLLPTAIAGTPSANKITPPRASDDPDRVLSQVTPPAPYSSHPETDDNRSEWSRDPWSRRRSHGTRRRSPRRTANLGMGLMDTRCWGGGPKFPQCEPTRRIRRRGGPPVRSGRYPDRGVCGGYSGVRRRVWLAPDRRELDRRRNAAV